MDDILNEFRKTYAFYISKASAQEKLGEAKGALSEQFSCVADILRDLSEEFKENYSFHDDIAEKITCFLAGQNAPVVSVVCMSDAFDRMNIEIVCEKIREPIKKSALKNAVSKICVRELNDAEVL